METPNEIGYYNVKVFMGERASSRKMLAFWDGQKWILNYNHHWPTQSLILSFEPLTDKQQ